MIGTCNKLRISLSIGAIFCSRLFLDLWICVDKLCKCIVDRLYSYFWIYESVLTTRQVVQMYCWQVIYYWQVIFGFMWYVYFNENNRSSKAGYESMIGCDLWIYCMRIFRFLNFVIGCDFFFFFNESTIMCIFGFLSLRKSRLWKM